jgi:hypothetical protein
MKKRLIVAAAFLVAALTASVVLAGQQDYPQVPIDSDTGAITPVAVEEPGPCPEDARVPVGSVCQLHATGKGQFDYIVISVGEDPAPCDRVAAPTGTDPSSCRVVDMDRSGSGESALVTFTRESGDGVVKVWVLPGEDHQIVLG